MLRGNRRHLLDDVASGFEELPHRRPGEEAKVGAVEDPLVLVVRSPADEKRNRDRVVAHVRHRRHHDSVRREEAPRSLEGAERVYHVLEHVQEHDRVERTTHCDDGKGSDRHAVEALGRKGSCLGVGSTPYTSTSGR